MADSTAPMPQNALAKVNQSARWKSRIIEKCVGLSILELPVGGLYPSPITFSFLSASRFSR